MSRAWLGRYQLGTVAFTVGTVVWGLQTYAASKQLDLAALAYLVGCAFFLDDAYEPFGRTTKSSYRRGSVAFAVGTLIWASDVYAATHAVDPAAALYALGCAHFLYDAYRARLPNALTRWLVGAPLGASQIGSLAFLAGTVVWAITGGLSLPVVAYGIGCVLYVLDAFATRDESATLDAPEARAVVALAST